MTKHRISPLFIVIATVFMAAQVQAKLPATSDDAKAAAAVAADKAAWGNKVGAFQLCKAQDRVAAQVLAQARSAGKPAQPTTTPACADPGPYVAAQAKPAETAAAPAAPAAPAPVAAAASVPSAKQPDAAVVPAKKP